ncbi:MAG: hypothetical protein IE917_20595 [Betaproteobacteria bacterium]|nr:hypothetical protein [Betaproteobacteria bacterium]
MKRIILAAIAATAMLSGCAQVAPGAAPVTAAQQATADQAQLQADWMQSCLLYNGAQKAVIANINHLTNAQLQQVLIITRQITPMCKAPPTDIATATVQITSAVTTITILAGATAAGVIK